MQNFCVMTIDLKRSKKLRNRALVQTKVLTLIDDLNQKFKKDLQAGFIMVLGDEFQGVLTSSKKAYQIFKYVKSRLEIESCCGVGIGSISTALSKNPSQMDGPAFYKSREALKEAKKEKVEIVIKSNNEEKDQLLNTMVHLILNIRKRWTKRQNQIINYFETHVNATQTEAAKHFNTSKQAMSKTVKITGWKEIRRAEKTVDELLGKLNSVNSAKSTKKG